jgi:hypothetical protein
MSRPDKVTSRFRGVVGASNIAGQFGPTGEEDLALVKLDANGELVVADQGEALGVIWTPEGKADPTVANFRSAISGSVVTVYTHAEFTDTGLTVGDELWSTTGGDVVTSAPITPTQKVGFVVNKDPNRGGENLVFSIAPWSV